MMNKITRKLGLIFGLICLIAQGCTFFRHDLSKYERKVDTRVIENNDAAYKANLETRVQLEKAQSLISTAIVPTNGEPAQITQTNYFNTKLSLDNASTANNVSGDFLRRNENMLGLPLNDQTQIVKDLLSSNSVVRAEAQRQQTINESNETNWRKQVADYKQKLEDYGAKFEEQRNAKIKFWTKWLTIIGVVVGGAVCLFVFFPPAIGLVVGAFPKIASLVGVVAHRAYAGLVQGIGNARNQLQVQAETAKTTNTPEPTYTASEALKLIDTHLVANTNDKDKKLVDATIAKVNV